MSIIRQRKIRNKRAKKIALIVVPMVVLICSVLMSYGYIRKQTWKENLSQSGKQETSEDIKKEDNRKYQTQRRNIPDDLRIHYFNNILTSDKLSVGDYADIRIRFENGMDFIILSKKMVVDLYASTSDGNENKSIWIEVSEEEILRMSSALVDGELEGRKIYAIQYIDELQKVAISNYPVTEEVKALIKNNPNVSNPGENVSEFYSRSGIELLQREIGTAEESNSEFESQYWNQERKEYQSKDSVDSTDEIIYLD